jgi:NADPH-dependent curcumin reductase CurA
VLVRHHYLSLDPYMRGRMNDGKSYAQPQPLGEVMIGGTVGEVVESAHPRFRRATRWWAWAAGRNTAWSMPPARRAAQGRHHPCAAVALPGRGRHARRHRLVRPGQDHRPKAGETVVVSAATGAVGSAFAALAKARGCRVVGIAGGPDKCRYATEELGFDACIDYKVHKDAKPCPRRSRTPAPRASTATFENVGGWMLDAVLLRMNAFGRIALCGMIAGYDGAPLPLAYPALILVNRLKVEGFIVSEHMEVWPEALKELGTLVGSGKLRPRESIAQGIEARPRPSWACSRASNFGKQLVKLI